MAFEPAFQEQCFVRFDPSTGCHFRYRLENGTKEFSESVLRLWCRGEAESKRRG